MACLLYTSDAADDLTRVELGGRDALEQKKEVRSMDRHLSYRDRA